MAKAQTNQINQTNQTNHHHNGEWEVQIYGRPGAVSDPKHSLLIAKAVTLSAPGEAGQGVAVATNGFALVAVPYQQVGGQAPDDPKDRLVDPSLLSKAVRRTKATWRDGWRVLKRWPNRQWSADDKMADPVETALGDGESVDPMQVVQDANDEAFVVGLNVAKLKAMADALGTERLVLMIQSPNEAIRVMGAEDDPVGIGVIMPVMVPDDVVKKFNQTAAQYRRCMPGDTAESES